ncbi:hypothetical protein CTI18_10865 [Prevotella intermedia]|uniref:Uncharacterized protein n=1 Tax=Prevotella intermedia TaxID=28131 RepID=A0A2G8I7B3_PREIN|nr:hypothetical protein CTI18_10865 [Prevotella intermedia]
MQPTFAEEAADKRVGLVRQRGNEYQRVATEREDGCVVVALFLPFSGFVVPALWQVQLQT